MSPLVIVADGDEGPIDIGGFVADADATIDGLPCGARVALGS